MVYYLAKRQGEDIDSIHRRYWKYDDWNTGGIQEGKYTT